MRGAVVVAEEVAYRSWLEKQPRFADLASARKTADADVRPAGD